jgi:hypothetical protein
MNPALMAILPQLMEQGKGLQNKSDMLGGGAVGAGLGVINQLVSHGEYQRGAKYRDAQNRHGWRLGQQPEGIGQEPNLWRNLLQGTVAGMDMGQKFSG